MWASNPDISITGSHRDEQQRTVVEHRRFSVGGFLAAAAGISQQKPAAGESWSTENSQGMEVKQVWPLQLHQNGTRLHVWLGEGHLKLQGSGSEDS